MTPSHITSLIPLSIRRFYRVHRLLNAAITQIVQSNQPTVVFHLITYPNALCPSFVSPSIRQPLFINSFSFSRHLVTSSNGKQFLLSQFSGHSITLARRRHRPKRLSTSEEVDQFILSSRRHARPI